jgi:hypothetical protein
MTEAKTSRRKFLTTGAATIAGGAAAAAFPNISVAADPVVLKVQAAWGGGIFLEFAQDYVKRVNEMSGGSLKIDLLGVGAVVKTAEMQTAVHKGVLDGAHLVTAYWYSKSPVASLFGTGPCFGWSANEAPRPGRFFLRSDAGTTTGLVQGAHHQEQPDERPQVSYCWTRCRRLAGNGHVGGATTRR